MRPILVLALTGAVVAGDAAAAAPAADQPITLEELRAKIDAARSRDPQAWSANDLDRDGRPSRVEVLASLLGNATWWRRNARADLRRVDRDGSNAVSIPEAQAVADRDPQWRFEIREHQRTIAQRQNLRAPPQPGAGFGVGSGDRCIAYCYFGNQQAYIMDYDVVNGQYDPVIGVLSSGTALCVTDYMISVLRRPAGGPPP